MTDLPALDIRRRAAWRAWLGRNQASSPGVWLVFHKDHTGVESIPYEDSVREALCFGWIDSLIKRLDDGRYARKFTPRKPTSRWSDINRKRWAELRAEGRLAAAGLAASPIGKESAGPRAIPELPAYVARAFKANPGAWAFFRRLPPGARRLYVGWIHLAKRPETRQRRIRESIALLAAGKRLGLK
jgi:uncharacterized protein YdeI (YjbR/CyaY-like superfamily)